MKIETIIDDTFDKHFRGLLQVFFYITDRCNLRCEHCYYKPWLKTDDAEINYDILISLLHKFREMGAIKLSLLGGEPTQYGRESENKALPFLIKEARDIGFEYIRIVTNGLFDKSILDHNNTKLLDEITFSIDGDTSEIHDRMRGRNTFNKSLDNLKLAVNLGYNVHITTCVHRNNIVKDGTKYRIERTIEWAHDLGVNLINFHPLFKLGIPRDSWTEKTDIDPDEWLKLYRYIRENIDNNKYPISVRIPQRFIPHNIFESKSDYYSYCPVKLGDRIEVHPNGQIHSCALNNGTPISLAKFYKKNNIIYIRWTGDDQNEIKCFPFDMSKNHPCAIINLNNKKYIPLCISFKPNQKEFIWKKIGLA